MVDIWVLLWAFEIFLKLFQFQIPKMRVCFSHACLLILPLCFFKFCPHQFLIYYSAKAGKESIAGSENSSRELDSQWCADTLLFFREYYYQLVYIKNRQCVHAQISLFLGRAVRFNTSICPACSPHIISLSLCVFHSMTPEGALCPFIFLKTTSSMMHLILALHSGGKSSVSCQLHLHCILMNGYFSGRFSLKGNICVNTYIH